MTLNNTAELFTVTTLSLCVADFAYWMFQEWFKRIFK